jgi:hypothetical protein
VPVQKDPQLESGQQLMLPRMYGAVLKKGFELEWNPGTKQVCNLCEQSDGRCSYSENKQFLGCLCTGGKVGVQDCNGGGATPAYAHPSSGKFLRTDRSILIPFENKRYLYHASPVNYLVTYSRLMSYKVTAISSNQVFSILTMFCRLQIYGFDDSKL